MRPDTAIAIRCTAGTDVLRRTAFGRCTICIAGATDVALLVGATVEPRAAAGLAGQALNADFIGRVTDARGLQLRALCVRSARLCPDATATRAGRVNVVTRESSRRPSAARTRPISSTSKSTKG